MTVTIRHAQDAQINVWEEYERDHYRCVGQRIRRDNCVIYRRRRWSLRYVINIGYVLDCAVAA